jgi:protein-tyrosine phosphatase
MSPRDRTSVLFICMGNICRSPLAECVFLHKAAAHGVSDRFQVDSAGTGGWHAGETPDQRMRQTAARYGVVVAGEARMVQTDDFEHFDHLICMDTSNLRDILKRGAPGDRARLLLPIDPAAPTPDVPDPYYGGPEGFEHVFKLVDRACDALLAELLDEETSET